MKKYVILGLFLLTIFSNVKAIESENIILTKEVSKENEIYGRDVSVVLSVAGESIASSETLDVVFVLDRSTSMNNTLTGEKTNDNSKTKMASVINTFKALSSDLLKEKGIQIGIVTFGNDVFDEYSTAGLLAKEEDVLRTINSIPIIFNKGGGTNIQSGLSKAKELLKQSEAKNKVIILLSDGQPTYFTNNEGNIIGAGNEDLCYNLNPRLNREQLAIKEYCLRNNNPLPSAKAIAEVSDLNDISLYSIGFGIEINSAAENFLKKLTPSKYYLALDSDKLKTSLTSIFNDIVIIAKEAVVTDIVPKDFIVSEDSLTKTFGNSVSFNKLNTGESVITWDIGNIDSTKEIKLTYNLLAVANEYGYMHTNNEAKLVAKDINDKLIEKYFPLPKVLIPALTQNDVYESVQGKKINIDISQGLLKNDLLSIHEDSDSLINDEIVILQDSLSCGENLVVNNDGSFIYQDDNCHGEVTFKYYLKTSLGNKYVISNTSQVTLDIKPQVFSYVVKYIDKDSNKELLTSRIVANNHLGDKISEKAKSIDNYRLVSDKVINYEITNANNQELVFYYRKTLVPITGITSNNILETICFGSGISLIILLILKKRFLKN